MIIQFKHFHDSLNIVVILTPRCEFFSAKCAQFILTFKNLNERHFSFGTVITHF